MAKRIIINDDIPSIEVPWDDGTQAYSGAAVERFIKRQLETLDAKVSIDGFNEATYGRLSNTDVERMRKRGVVIIHGYGSQWMDGYADDGVYLIPPVEGRTTKAYVQVGDSNWYGYTYGSLNEGNVAKDGYYIDRYSSILYRVSNGQVERLSVQNQALMLDDWLSNDLDSLSQRLETISETIEPSMVTEIEWSALVSKRNNSQLTPGMWYRITDYLTTTVQEDTQSANHPFDLLVMATSPSTLSEEAKAIKSARDTANYFANANLNAWRIWYCLDNDTSKYAWADAVGGKGVIYRMIDEYNNDCPYDFKNIRYKRYYKSSVPFSAGFYETDKMFDEGPFSPTYKYTFVDSLRTSLGNDESLKQSSYRYFIVENNVIKPFFSNARYQLPNNILAGVLCRNNYIDYCSCNNTFDSCTKISIGKYCCNIIAKNTNFLNTSDNSNRIILSNTEYIALGTSIYNLVILNGWRITIGDNCVENTIGTFGGDYVMDVKLGNNCSYNTISRGCSQIKIGDNCTNNILKEYVRYLTMEEQCNHNEIPANCWYVTLDKNVGNLTLRSTSSYAPQNVHIYGGIDTYVESEGGYGYGYGYGAGGGDIYTVEVNASAPFTEVKPIGTETHYL